MANITYRQEAFASRERGAAYLRRVSGAFRLGFRNFTVDLDRARPTFATWTSGRCATSEWSATPVEGKRLVR
jgi:hypothetical protein